MATLSFCMASSVKVVAASKVSKKSAPKEESKNFFQFLTDAFARDQLFENDPVLKKVESVDPRKGTAKKTGFSFGKK